MASLSISELNISELNISELNISELNISELNISELSISELSISEARQRLPELVDRVARNQEPLIITRRGHPVARIVPLEADSANQHPLRGLPLLVADDFDAPLDGLWESVDS